MEVELRKKLEELKIKNIDEIIKKLKDKGLLKKALENKDHLIEFLKKHDIGYSYITEEPTNTRKFKI